MVQLRAGPVRGVAGEQQAGDARLVAQRLEDLTHPGEHGPLAPTETLGEVALVGAQEARLGLLALVRLDSGDD